MVLLKQGFSCLILQNLRNAETSRLIIHGAWPGYLIFSPHLEAHSYKRKAFSMDSRREVKNTAHEIRRGNQTAIYSSSVMNKYPTASKEFANNCI